MGKFKDLTGQRFGKLLAIGPIDKDKWGEFVWLCACDCGGIVKARGSSLTGNHTKSCGCIKKTLMRAKSGVNHYRFDVSMSDEKRKNKRAISGYSPWTRGIKRKFNYFYT